MSFVVTAILMFGFWIALSGYFDAFHLTTGIISSMIVAFVSHDLLIGKSADIRLEIVRILRFIRYLPWLLLEIVKANIDVVRRTIHPKLPIDPRVITVKSNIKTDLGKVTFANSITLTPGTVTILVTKDDEFIVHALSKEAADTLLEGEMARRVEEVEGKHV